ncbi:hypothetical protein GCM10022223_43530 [Kineosporia mesophila]|uniref:Type I restriction modification DNA specificity domain-containing protein n=1 Tax=Kineosporia mesophila TaxID=566012 RepID=A0ABP6ZXI5_9ACTN|nr:restriction endonuclease subunit S [Kineosporia mesophila]MCD5353218.1 restriction endonuclease subunit S [Kineosporia mesophila]
MTPLESVTGPHPSGWEIATLGNLCEMKSSPKSLEADIAFHEGVPVISPAQIGNGQIDLLLAQRIPLDKAKRLERHRLRLNDIVMIRTGDRLEHALLTGDAAVQAPIAGGSCFRIRVISDDLLPEYLSWYLNRPAVQEWMGRRDSSGVVRHRRMAELASLPIPLPALPEQSRMAEIGRLLERKIRVHEEAADVARRLRDEVARSMLAGR